MHYAQGYIWSYWWYEIASLMFFNHNYQINLFHLNINTTFAKVQGELNWHSRSFEAKRLFLHFFIFPIMQVRETNRPGLWGEVVFAERFYQLWRYVSLYFIAEIPSPCSNLTNRINWNTRWILNSLSVCFILVSQTIEGTIR